jgi:hypothetical protein
MRPGHRALGCVDSAGQLRELEIVSRRCERAYASNVKYLLQGEVFHRPKNIRLSNLRHQNRRQHILEPQGSLAFLTKLVSWASHRDDHINALSRRYSLA